MELEVKNPSANAGDTGEADLIPGSGRSPGVGNGSILAEKTPWTEESVGLLTMGPQRVRHD